MTELEQYIQPFFGLINTNDLKTISSFFKPQKINKSDVLLQANTYCHYLSFVQTGLFRVFSYTEDGREVTQWISTKGYFVTDLSSFVVGTPAKWCIQALTDGELYSLSKDDYIKLAEVLPKWKDLEKLFIVKCFATMEERIFMHLSMTTEERYLYFLQHYKEIFMQVPQQYIASMLGMTPETFSRIRNKLAK